MIPDTVAASHDLGAFAALLTRKRTLVLLGVPAHAHLSPEVGSLIFQRRTIAKSPISGIAETQELLDFCGENEIVSDIEVIRIKTIDEAYGRVQRGDIRYRFVIENATLAA